MPSYTRRSLLLLGATGLLSACTATIPMMPSGDVAPEALTQDQILATINAVRRANGRPAWSYNTALERAAQAQSDLMARRGEMSHDLGVTLRQRVTTAGYYGAVGENLAGGHKNLAQAIEGWLASPGHRSTLLSDKFVEFGLATARPAPGTKSRYPIYWTMIAGGSFEAWLKVI